MQYCCCRFPYHLEYYTEVLDLNKLLDIDDGDPFMQKYHTLNEYVAIYLFCSDFSKLVAVYKRRPQSGELSSADILRIRERGFFRSGYPYFLEQKLSDFSKFMVCPHGQGPREV